MLNYTKERCYLPLPSNHLPGQRLVVDSFYDIDAQQAVWGGLWGACSPVGPIQKVLIHRPGNELRQLDNKSYETYIDDQILHDNQDVIGNDLTGTDPIDVALLHRQHDQLRQALLDSGAEVIDLDFVSPNHPKSVYIHDLGLVVPGGVILARLALGIRQGEEQAAYRTFAKLGIPVLATIQGNGFMEGGSFTMLDERSAVVGRSVRVNQAGIDQLRTILAWQEMELMVVDLPADRIHLDELFMLVDTKTALVEPKRLPYWFLKELRSRGYRLIYTDPNDPDRAANCLTLAPGHVLIASEYPGTIKQLQQAGIRTKTIDTTEIRKIGGGIHCAALPLVRGQ